MAAPFLHGDVVEVGALGLGLDEEHLAPGGTPAVSASLCSSLARRIVVDPGVAAVPGTSFYADPAHGAGQIRFAFPKRLETLHAAAERLAKLR